LIKGGKVSLDGDGFEIQRSLPHGHVAAAMSVLRDLGLHKIIAPRRSRQRDLAVAMIVARIIDPQSKLATARGLSGETAFTSLGEALGLGEIDENDLYAAMDWLLARQGRIEAALAGRHLHDGTLVLYDLSSSYFEGKTCPLARLGYSRDGKKGTLQIVYGMLCDVQGRPIAIEVFQGNTGDPATLATQVDKIRNRFSLARVVLVGDRGMITEARIREDLDGVEGLNWITALRGPAIRGLVKAGHLQPSLFDQTDMAEIASPDYPGQRLIVCRNPLLAEQRRHKRQELLEATEGELAKVVKAVTRTIKPLRGSGKIGLRVGRIINRHKVAKHFAVRIGEDSLTYERKGRRIAEEAALDGFYVIRTDVPAAVLDAEQTVRSYKGLAKVERAFRRIKTVDLHIRPIRHRTADRVRAHVLLCMLAYYVEWHMRERLAPVLFDDEDPAAGRAMQASPVAPAQRSPAAKRKAATKRTEDGWPAHSFQTVLADLATIAKNRIQPSVAGAESFEKTTCPTSNQQRMLNLLGVSM